MFFRNVTAADRNLRYGEQDICKLERRFFRRFVRMSHRHVRMNGGIAAHQPQRQDVLPVAQTVAGTEHIAEGTHERSHVALTEFDQNIRL